jgi:hypothetical protein
LEPGLGPAPSFLVRAIRFNLHFLNETPHSGARKKHPWPYSEYARKVVFRRKTKAVDANWVNWPGASLPHFGGSAMARKCKSYLARNWKRLTIANLGSFAVQGVLFAGLVFVGVDTMASLAGAKAASWATFLAAVCRKA